MYFLEDFHGYGADKGLKPTSEGTRTRLKSKLILHKNVFVCMYLHVHIETSLLPKIVDKLI